MENDERIAAGAIRGLLSRLMHESRAAVLLSVGTGILSGLCGAGMAAVMGRAMVAGGAAPHAGLLFFALCGFYFGLKSLSELLLERTTQQAVLRLREMLARKLLDATMTKLEGLGKAQLQAILTADVAYIVEACRVQGQVYLRTI
jgi:putative ATP-binding cassette transporter